MHSPFLRLHSEEIPKMFRRYPEEISSKPVMEQALQTITSAHLSRA